MRNEKRAFLISISIPVFDSCLFKIIRRTCVSINANAFKIDNQDGLSVEICFLCSVRLFVFIKLVVLAVRPHLVSFFRAKGVEFRHEMAQIVVNSVIVLYSIYRP